MERIATDLALRLAVELESFARSSERLLHVRCDSHTAKLAEAVTAAVTGRAPAISLVLRSPVSGGEHEWGARAVELACWYVTAERERVARGERARGALPRGLFARPDASCFAAVLGAVLARIGSDAPVYVVFAPLAASRALDALTITTIARTLPAHARVVCLDRGAPPSELRTAGARFVDLRLDEAELRSAISARFEAMAAAPDEATGPRATGAAGPRTAPPPRPGAPRPSPELEETRRRAARARRAIAAFAAALARGDALAILETQRAASEALSAMGARSLATRLRVARAGALAATGRTEEALRECQAMRDVATAERDPAVAAAALASAGGILVAAGRIDAARSMYAELATVTEAAGDPLFAAHALWSCARLALRSADPTAAAAALDRALAIGERAEPHVALAGPFDAVASELAALCRAHGLEARALEVERRQRALVGRAHEVISTAREEDP